MTTTETLEEEQHKTEQQTLFQCIDHDKCCIPKLVTEYANVNYESGFIKGVGIGFVMGAVSCITIALIRKRL